MQEKVKFMEEFMKNQLKLMVSKKVAERSHFGSNIEILLYAPLLNVMYDKMMIILKGAMAMKVPRIKETTNLSKSVANK